MSASAAAASGIAVHRKKVIQHFVTVGATSAERAIAVESLPREALNLLEDLKRAEVLHTTGSGALYVDMAREEALQSVRRSFMSRMLLVVGLVALATVALLTLR